MLLLIESSCAELSYGNCPMEIMDLLAKVKKNRRNKEDPGIIHLSHPWIVSASKEIQVVDGETRNCYWTDNKLFIILFVYELFTHI